MKPTWMMTTALYQHTFANFSGCIKFYTLVLKLLSGHELSMANNDDNGMIPMNNCKFFMVVKKWLNLQF